MVAALLGGAALLRRRKRLAGVVIAAALFGVSRPALADDPNSGPIDGPAAALSGDSDAAVVGKVDRGGAFFGRIAAGGSYDNAALSAETKNSFEKLIIRCSFGIINAGRNSA